MADRFVLFRPEVHGAAPSGGSERGTDDGGAAPSFTLYDPTCAPWSCRYGCTGVEIGERRAHEWWCKHWQREGKTETPF